MSNAFNDREKGFERKYEFDEHQRFRTQARRDKLFGQWAATQLGLSGATAEAYVLAVVDSNFEAPGDDDMLNKVRKDFADNKLRVSDTEIKARLSAAHDEAARQVAAGE